MGVYGSGGESLTPHLDAFARDAVRFDAAYVQIPFTLPSHMSMFTSLYPDVHGVSRPDARLREGVATLPQILQGEGYFNIGLVTNRWMKGEFGFNRGFRHYRQLRYGLTYAQRVNDQVLKMLRRMDLDSRPAFVFLHYLDAHSDFHNVTRSSLPYFSPPEYREGLDVSEDGSEFCFGPESCATGFLTAADREHRDVPAEQVQQIARLYDRGVRYLDDRLGELFAALREMGIYDDALVLVTSDHGEEFREHGLFLHSQTYDETTGVPLLVKLPGGEAAGTVVEGLVESVDIAPTVLDVLGIEVPPGLQGKSLLPLVRGDGPGREAVLSQDKLQRTRYSLRTDRYKLIHDFDSGQTELYDLAADPGESRDLMAAGEPVPAAARLLTELKERVGVNRLLARRLAAEAGESVLTEDDRQKLKSIGYVD